MKYSFLVAIVFGCLSANVSAQDTIRDPNGVLVAVYKKAAEEGRMDVVMFHPNGKMQGEGQIQEDSLMIGPWKRYDKRGEYSGVITYAVKEVDGNKFSIKQGKSISYFSNGNIREEGDYNEDRRHGPWQHFFPNGFIKEAGEYDNNNRIGVWRFNFRSGELREEGQFTKNLKSGEWKIYHKNGQVSAIGMYEKGKNTGDWVWYHDNGKVQSEGAYKNGFKEGNWKFYHKTGELKSAGPFKSNKREGHFEEYSPAGKVMSEGYYTNDKKTGDWIERAYIPGETISYGPLKMGSYFRGKKAGTWVTYGDKKKRILEVSYEEGVQEGDYKEYYANGQLKTHHVYKGDLLWSIVGCYSPKGKDLEGGTLKDGNGSVIHYDDEGEVMRTDNYKDGKKLADY